LYSQAQSKFELAQTDADTYELLCVSVKSVFPKFEKKFCENIFLPFQDQKEKVLLHTTIGFFEISLCWKDCCYPFAGVSDNISPPLVKAAEDANM